MMQSKILIVGAGLSGLLIGYRLKNEGIPFVIIEARDRIGGRIHTVKSSDETPIDMGATWFSDYHKNVLNLLKELNISYFDQYMEGSAFFQPFSNAPADSISIPNQAPSYRISGGTSSLTNALAEEIGNDFIVLNQEVKRIEFLETKAKVQTNNTSFFGEKVILAIPPKLWSNKIDFSPLLPDNLKNIATNTHTWMEDSIKIALTFDHPFWRQKQQSGTLISNTGPITELYDHCNFEENKFALCGFMDPSYKKVTFEERKNLIIKQLGVVFGEAINSYIDYKETVWSTENNTYCDNSIPLFHHQNNGDPIFHNTYFNERLLISSTESASIYSGYMEGAVVSATSVAEKIINCDQYHL